MQTGHELFLHELSDMMDAERQLIDALEENANDSSRPELKKAFEQHRKQTEGHLQRLEQCFELLGEEPDEAECHGIRGLVAEKESFTEEDPSDDLIDVFNVGAAVKIESYEVCAYESLIDMAREMKHTKVAKLLGQTLKEEQATLKKMETFSKKVKPDQMMSEQGSEEEQEEQEQRSSSRARSSRSRKAA